MKSNYLLPHIYKRIGWFMAIPFLVVGFFLSFFENQFDKITQNWPKNLDFDGDFLDEIICIGLIVGMLLVAFSREKTEDEYINKVRLESLQLSVLINYLLLIICILVFYDMNFFSVMVYNMFTTLLIFIIRFNFLIYRNK